ncbi:MAG: hypothetical protein NT033_09275, partial [Candidatus Omnitrophica bacterium]|nr:hypothetical protein [Candidatus Omnitrophota bacterium]
MIGFIYRKSIEKKFFVSAAFFTLIVFSPYIYYLLFKCGIRSLPNLMRHATIMTRFDIFIEHLGMSSFDFFRYYFGGDFNMILAKVAGPFRFVLYPFSCLLMVFFAIGSFLYLRWIIKTKRFFSEDKEEVKNCPVVFQIAGFITLLVTLGYMFSLPRVYPHYLIILFPAQAIIAGFAANRLWLLPGARVIIIGAILSTLLLLCGTLIFLKGSGGHPREYGPNYSLLV